MSWKIYQVLQYLKSDKPHPWTSPERPRGMMCLKADYENFYSYWVHESTNPSEEQIIQYTGKPESVRFYVPKSVWKEGNPEEYVEVKAEKRNENHVTALIQQKLDNYIFDNRDRSPDLFKEQEKCELEIFRKFLCPNYKTNGPHLSIFRDLEVYEKCLTRIIGESTKDDNRRKEAVPNYVRYHVLTKVLDYSKLSDLSKDEKIKILHWITDASGASAYKAIFTSQKSGVKQHVEEQSKIDPDEIFELINKILDN